MSLADMISQVVILLTFALTCTYALPECNKYVFSVGRIQAFTAGSSIAVIPFDIVNHNDNTVFDIVTSTFTAPVAGVYAFAFSAASGNGYMTAFLHSSVDGYLATAVGPNTNSQGANTVYKQLGVGTQVTVQLAAGRETRYCNPPCTTFSGFLLCSNTP